MDKQLHQYFSFKAPHDVVNICNPLMNIFDANLFVYQRSIIDEKAMCVSANAYLCNNADALEFILSIKPKNREKAKYDYVNTGRKYVLLETTQPQFTSALRDKFNFNNILCRDEQIDKNEWEHFIIGTPSSDTKIINKYLNNIELLDKFAVYFRDKATKLINNACSDRFVSKRPIEKCDFRNLGSPQNDHDVEKNSMLLIPEHYCLTNQYDKRIIIPRAEMRCLILLSNGRSIKEIARTFGISSRTVESHIKNAKLRLKCDAKTALLDVLEKWKKFNTWSM